jgi:hypothetical protein
VESLVEFDLGKFPDSISHTIKEGFGWLWSLYLASCQGDICMFVKNTPIDDLKDVKIWEEEETGVDSSELLSNSSSKELVYMK